MKPAILLLILISVGNATEINLPQSIRQRNWIGSNGDGSCVHASMVMLLRWQRQYKAANYWKRSHSSGETWTGLTTKLEASGVRWAGTYNKNDVRFLEWAIRTRRGCMVTTQRGHHMILLVGLDAKTATLLDNNSPDRVIRKSRSQFLQEWFDSNSWALTPMYTPPPPLLRNPDEKIYSRVAFVDLCVGRVGLLLHP